LHAGGHISITVQLLCVAALLLSCRSVIVGVSIERLTHDRYKWRGEDIANINTVAQRYARLASSSLFPNSSSACELMQVM
jgi:hypothetical protein